MANDKGAGARIVERGRHEALIDRRGGVYAELYRMAEGGLSG